MLYGIAHGTADKYVDEGMILVAGIGPAQPILATEPIFPIWRCRFTVFA